MPSSRINVLIRHSSWPMVQPEVYILCGSIATQCSLNYMTYNTTLGKRYISTSVCFTSKEMSLCIKGESLYQSRMPESLPTSESSMRDYMYSLDEPCIQSYPHLVYNKNYDFLCNFQ